LKYIAQKKIKNSNRYELEVAMEDKMYLGMNYSHQLGNVEMDETPAKSKAQEL
jgi:hypothetical protein